MLEREGQELDVISMVKAGDLAALKRIPSDLRHLCGTGENAAKDKYDGYCIHWAAGCGHLQCLRWLVETANANPSIMCEGSGRQPAHYAARNGHLGCVRYLLEYCDCDLNALAKHGVSPLQLAVWQNQLEVAKFLCESPLVQACPLQVNEFECSLVHWLATATPKVGGKGGALLLPMAEWLLSKNCDFFAPQRSGHTPLHKAAWGGHLILCKWLHYKLGVMDNVLDSAGNFAADCASMGRHENIAYWLRDICSSEREESLKLLGLDVSLGRPQGTIDALIHESDDEGECASRVEEDVIRSAFYEKAKECHPDKNSSPDAADMFAQIQRAYEHLIVERGIGHQRNKRHDINAMISYLPYNTIRTCHDGDYIGVGSIANEPNSPLTYFKARLLATILDYGSNGMPASSLRKKWNEIWPENPFPSSDEMRKLCPKLINGNQHKKIKMLLFLKTVASDCCRIVYGNKGEEPTLTVVDRIESMRIE